MENQFGDILSDLGAGIVGGLGLAPSAEIGEGHALFQPSHGSAPQLAGKNVANPIAMILTVAMMLDWLDETHDDSAAITAAIQIERALAQTLKEGTTLTQELGGSATTSNVAATIVRQLE
jgi:3-isopropylmalate dehydrogenase